MFLNIVVNPEKAHFEATIIQKIDKLTEIIYQMRPEVGKHCWQVSLF